MMRVSLRTIAIAALTLIVGSVTANASTFKTLYSFCNPNNCLDGELPYGKLVMDSEGTLYGMTKFGGAYNRGDVFSLSPNAKRTKWKFKVIHSFCSFRKCDGIEPQGSLIIDTAGRLYGLVPTTNVAQGAAFKLTPDLDRKKWKFETLYTFCPNGGNNCPDGSQPQAGLTYAGAAFGQPYDGVSPLYGTTRYGGLAALGVAFELAPTEKKKWREKVIYSFCQLDSCADGSQPSVDLLIGSERAIFGTSIGGGTSNDGTVFALTRARTKSVWIESVLHSFCDTESCPGEYPETGLSIDANHNLFGFTGHGGLRDGGTAFELVPDGSNYTFSSIYQFCGSPVECDVVDGPVGPPTLDAAGNIFSMTTDGGAYQMGTVFSLSAGPNPQLTVLHDFCADQESCADGAAPGGALLKGPDGVYYGVTGRGGNGFQIYGGTIFEYTP